MTICHSLNLDFSHSVSEANKIKLAVSDHPLFSRTVALYALKWTESTIMIRRGILSLFHLIIFTLILIDWAQGSIVPCFNSKYDAGIEFSSSDNNTSANPSTHAIKMKNGSLFFPTREIAGNGVIEITEVSGRFPGLADQGITWPTKQLADITVEFYLHKPGNGNECLNRLGTIDDNSKPDWGMETIRKKLRWVNLLSPPLSHSLWWAHLYFASVPIGLMMKCTL